MKRTPPSHFGVVGLLAFLLAACSTNSAPSTAVAPAAPTAPAVAALPPAPPPVPVLPPLPAVVAQPVAPSRVEAPVAIAEPAVEAAGGDTAGGGPIDFDSQVTPFFAKYCYSCHDKDGRASGIGFDNKADILQTVVPGDADNSDLYDVLVTRKMPKGRIKPTAEEIEMIRQWINEGAKISNSIPAEG